MGIARFAVAVILLLTAHSFHDHAQHVDYEEIEEEASRLAWLSLDGFTKLIKEHS
jgi:hypothetical protein